MHSHLRSPLQPPLRRQRGRLRQSAREARHSLCLNHNATWSIGTNARRWVPLCTQNYSHRCQRGPILGKGKHCTVYPAPLLPSSSSFRGVRALALPRSARPPSSGRASPSVGERSHVRLKKNKENALSRLGGGQEQVASLARRTRPFRPCIRRTASRRAKCRWLSHQRYTR